MKSMTIFLPAVFLFLFPLSLTYGNCLPDYAARIEAKKKKFFSFTKEYQLMSDLLTEITNIEGEANLPD